ncbi:MAG: PorP/SprF family type IX secretion system membrane protein [Bacteroidota bacterium]|nr:PorP/SprF family type IX secretion system membrane protein [Bacteroidota bacterium]
MKTYYYLIALILLLFCINSKAQDPVFSNFFTNRLFLNPAFAGDDGPGRVRAASLHRNIFRPMRGPMNATNFGLDYGLCNANIGIGLLAGNETQGDGFLSSNHAGIVLSVKKDLTRNCYGTLGFQMSYMSQSVDWNQFIFSDQLDPVYGVTMNSTNQNMNRQFSNQKDMSLGALVKWWDWKRVNTLGINFSHAPSRTNVGYLSNYQIPVRASLHYGFFYKPNPSIPDNAKELQVRIDKQDKFIISIINFNWYINDKIAVGSGFRASFYNSQALKNTQNALFNVSLLPTQNIKILASYEASFGGINLAGGGNSFELGIIFTSKTEMCSFRSFTGVFKSKRKTAARSTPCPVFNKAKIIAPF